MSEHTDNEPIGEYECKVHHYHKDNICCVCGKVRLEEL